MKLGALLFLGFLVILLVCLAYPLAHAGDWLRTMYLESAEEPLVDIANVLGASVGGQMERGEFRPADFARMFADARARRVGARIYNMRKDSVDLNAYITDINGFVIFDSSNPKNVGVDFSEWRDVQMTLAGEYGARVRRDPDDDGATKGTAALMVAAPVMVAGKLAGVLTVIKPTTNIGAFLDLARPRALQAGAIVLAGMIVLTLVMSIWMTQQIGRLTRYADDVREGRRVPFPKLAPTELRTMGEAFEKMREALAGQDYVERYVQALTHEIKSPISAIRGAAEILEGYSVTEERRVQFLATILRETRRIHDLVDRMLKLTELEGRRALSAPKPVVLGAIARTVAEAVAPALEPKHLSMDVRIAEDVSIVGDQMLLNLAISNLVQNAIDFSPLNGKIVVTCKQLGDQIELLVDDQGSGIPDFARNRVFEKFYSLERSDTGKKSTGLGLNFVKEVASLHGGSVEVSNLPERGLRARLVLPMDLQA